MPSCHTFFLRILLPVLLRFTVNATAQVPDTLLHSIYDEQGGAANDQFGTAVDVSGRLLVVGIPFDDTGATDTGRAFVYDLGSSTPTVPVFTLNNPTPAGNDQFGSSVAISGMKVAVGAYLDDTTGSQTGSVYVYDLSGGTPTLPIATLHEPSPSNSFGFSVCISGSLVVVGANFNSTGGASAGAAYIYNLDSGTPTVPSVTLYNPSPAAGDRFGREVAISGTHVVVGVYLDDTGATDSGCAYVYDVSSGTPTIPVATLNNPSPVLGDWFGRSVAISGARVLIGAWFDNTGAGDAGSAYVYDLNSGTPTVPISTLNNPNPAVSDQFGGSVAISGSRAVVGTYFDDAGATDSGSVYVYDLSSGTPTTPAVTLNNPSPASTDRFGSSVAIDGTTVAVGTPLDDSFLADDGAVYIFGPAPEIALEQPTGANLVDGSASVSFSGLATGTSSAPKIFTIKNTGPGNLTLGTITTSGANAGDFVVNTSGMSAPLASGNDTSFTVTFVPSGAASSTRTTTLQIANNDTDESPFDITLVGVAYSATTDTDIDGMNDWQEVQLASLGFNWEVNQAALVNTYFTTANQNGLYTQPQLQGLYVGTPMITRDPLTQQFKLTIGIQKSTNLINFGPFPILAPGLTVNPQGEIEYRFTVPDNTAFFLLQTQ